MDDKDNFYRTRDLCEDLSKILNLTNPGTHNFARIFELALIHKVVEDYIDADENTPVKISIPFIGDMILRVKDGDVVLEDFILEDRFKKHIIEALVDKKSPLVLEAEESLIRRIKNRYDSLI